MTYEWLPNNPSANTQRAIEALGLDLEACQLEAVWRELNCQKCCSLLAGEINKRRRWAAELRDRRRRYVPIIPRSRPS